MKKIIISLLLCAGAVSCYEDKTSFPTDQIPDVVLTGAESELRIGYQEQLDVVPDLTFDGQKLSGDRFSFLWEINNMPRSTEFETIGTEEELHVVLSNMIADNYYLLRLTVVDEAFGLEYLFSWKVYVQPSFLDGLLVCDTQDGATSDLTLIQNDRLSLFAQKEQIFRNIIESSTGAPYPSLLGDMIPSLWGTITSGHRNNIWAIDAAGEPVRFNSQDYSFTNGSDIVPYFPEGNRFTKIFRVSAYNNTSGGALCAMTTFGNYCVNGMNSDMFGLPAAVFSQTSPKNGKLAYRSYVNSSITKEGAAWVDEATNRIVTVTFSGMGTIQSIDPVANPEAGTPAFDAENLGDITVAEAGMIEGESVFAFLFKDNAGGYAIHTVSTTIPAVTDWDDETWETIILSPEIPAAPRAKIALPADVCAMLDRNTGTVFTPLNSILYVATPEGLSAVQFSTGTATNEGVKFTPDAGERITSVKIYQQGQYIYNASMCAPDDMGEILRPMLELTNQAVIVTTQKSDAEGFVYVVPMTQLGTGNLDASKALKYGGFGKILDVCTTGY